MSEQPMEGDQETSGAKRLTDIEARVLGCLVEKEATTPDAYPLTLNALTTACNQKTSREPVMKLEPGRVGQALRELERKGLVRHQFSSRADRYRHVAEKGLALTQAQLALLALLMLRGPQTIGELLTRSERLHRFDDAEEVGWTLERLMQKDPPFAARLPRQSGQREDRYAHLLCGPVETATPAPLDTHSDDDGPDAGDAPLVERIEALERRVADLESRLGDDD
jgi:uncharacterized protein YceH (UPF0502 family)